MTHMTYWVYEDDPTDRVRVHGQFVEQPGFHESRLIRKADVAASLRDRSYGASRLRLW